MAEHFEANIDILRVHFAYDPRTGHIKWAKSTGRSKIGSYAGTKNHHGYTQIVFRGRPYMAHRIAWALHHGDWPEGILDHVNGISTDNRIGNLRIATASENAANRRLCKGIPKGVYYDLRSRRFYARGCKDGIRYYLGCYKTSTEAQKAYIAWASKAFGEFAHV